MPYTPPSATPEEKKKQEIMQQVIQKTVGVVDILARTMVDSALGRTYANKSSSYDFELNQNEPKSQTYKLSTPTLVDFVQKIVWPNTYVFDSGWTEPPNQEKKGGAMRGIGITAATETTNIFGTAIISLAKKTSWYENATTETQKAIDDLDKLYKDFVKLVPTTDDEGKKMLFIRLVVMI